MLVLLLLNEHFFLYLLLYSKYCTAKMNNTKLLFSNEANKSPHIEITVISDGIDYGWIDGLLGYTNRIPVWNTPGVQRRLLSIHSNSNTMYTYVYKNRMENDYIGPIKITINNASHSFDLDGRNVNVSVYGDIYGLIKVPQGTKLPVWFDPPPDEYITP